MVLLSHDHHGDNLDDAGRALLAVAGVVLTTTPWGQAAGRQRPRPPTIRLEAELRAGEALVFDWTSLAFCCAAAGEISLRPTTLRKAQRSPAYLPLRTGDGPSVFAHRRAYPMLVGRDIEVDCRRRLGVRSFLLLATPDLGLHTSFGWESGGDRRDSSASGANAPPNSRTARDSPNHWPAVRKNVRFWTGSAPPATRAASDIESPHGLLSDLSVDRRLHPYH